MPGPVSKKLSGIVQEGPYRGQRYRYAGPAEFPYWISLWLESESGCARREVREEFLEDLTRCPDGIARHAQDLATCGTELYKSVFCVNDECFRCKQIGCDCDCHVIESDASAQRP
jgi:hypothetical protein